MKTYRLLTRAALIMQPAEVQAPGVLAERLIVRIEFHHQQPAVIYKSPIVRRRRAPIARTAAGRGIPVEDLLANAAALIIIGKHPLLVAGRIGSGTTPNEVDYSSVWMI
ncbi:MAG: hypothetical protein ABII12_02190 [Planctomycetota bacterium]